MDHGAGGNERPMSPGELRQELAKARCFARRLKDEEHEDPVPPPLPPARVLAVPGRGEMFVRMTEGSGPGPPVVLLHGWALSADLNWFSGGYDVAAGHGPVVAPDLRGHGRGLRSDKPLTLEAMADDVGALVRHLELGPAVLVGYSMGGSVALLTWRHHRDVVAGMVLISTGLQWRTSLRERVIWSSMAAVEYAFRLGTPEGGLADRYLRMAVEQSPGLKRYRSWVKAEIRRGDPSDIAAAGRGLSAFDAHDFARRVDVPTAVVVTARDRLIRPHRQRELADAIPGARRVEVDGAHNAWLVRPDRFTVAVDEALAHVVGATRAAAPAGVAELADVADPAGGAELPDVDAAPA